jgi:hypothetical protein
LEELVALEGKLLKSPGASLKRRSLTPALAEKLLATAYDIPEPLFSRGGRRSPAPINSFAPASPPIQQGSFSKAGPATDMRDDGPPGKENSHKSQVLVAAGVSINEKHVDENSGLRFGIEPDTQDKRVAAGGLQTPPEANRVPEPRNELASEVLRLQGDLAEARIVAEASQNANEALQRLVDVTNKDAAAMQREVALAKQAADTARQESDEARQEAQGLRKSLLELQESVQLLKEGSKAQESESRHQEVCLRDELQDERSRREDAEGTCQELRKVRASPSPLTVMQAS